MGKLMVTINPELEMDQYHLPKPEELFAKLAGGKRFPLHMPINRYVWRKALGNLL